MGALLAILIILAMVGLVGYGASARIVRQYERGVVFRLGRVHGRPREPGFVWIAPFVDQMRKVNVQIVTLPIPAQDGITRDNVTVRVDAVVYFRVHDPVDAIVEVQDYEFAVSQVAQTSLRSIIGKSELDDLLSNRESLNQGLALMIDSPAVGWGIEIDRVEIKDVALPETMKRSMSRQAEAERERRSRVITADGELQASHKLASAASAMSETPAVAAAAAADHRRGGRREELDRRAAVPGRAAALPGACDGEAGHSAGAAAHAGGGAGRVRPQRRPPAERATAAATSLIDRCC
nr:slipin family protein [Jiangella anatolica]